jgi:hypothetical protein
MDIGLWYSRFENNLILYGRYLRRTTWVLEISISTPMKILGEDSNMTVSDHKPTNNLMYGGLISYSKVSTGSTMTDEDETSRSSVVDLEYFWTTPDSTNTGDNVI